MPENAPELAVLSASINGGEYSPVGLRMDMNVNSFPSVVASIAPDSAGAEAGASGSVVVPISSAVISRIARLQEARLAGRVDPDFDVTAEDGRGGSLHYQGFISAPLLDITKVSTTDQLSSVGHVGALDALDLSIYDAGYELAREEASDSLDPLPSASDGDLPKLLADITDVLVKNYDLVLAAEHRPVAQTMLEIQHEINNDGPLALWKAILAASDVQFESWTEACKTCPPLARELSERVKSVLKSQTPGFWSKINGLLADFQMIYVPEFNGPGKFRRADVRVDDESAATVEASVSGLGVVDGSPKILQIGGVVMMGASAPADRPESSEGFEGGRVVAYAPDPLRRGYIHRANPPFWLLREGGIPVLGSEVEESSAVDGKVNLSLADRAKRQEQGLAYKAKVDTVSEGVMTEMCEIMFKDMQLANSTTSLNLPLDFSVNAYIGNRVRIQLKEKDGSDGGSFTAFVAGISHSIDLRQGKELNSSTQMRLTHAKYS